MAFAAISEHEEVKLIQLLSKLEVSVLPFEIFLQIARLIVLPILEIVPLRLKDGQIEVLLLKRAEDDPLWPGQLHTPGSVIRAYDEGSGFDDAVSRIIEDELKNTQLSELNFVKTFLNQNERGKECANVYWTEVIGEAKVGEFHSSEAFPGNIMRSQISFINQAVDSFKKIKQVA